MIRRALPIGGLLALMFSASFVGAFYDEIALLKMELQNWEKSNTADFSDVVSRLDGFSAPVFRDVSEADWFSPYVASLAEWDIVSGYKDPVGQPTGEFRPGNAVTVAEILKMALEAAQVNEESCVQPVQNPSAKNHWAAEYVACAEEMGVRLLNPQAQTNIDRSARRAEVLSVIHDAFATDVLLLYSNYHDTVSHPLEADIAFATMQGVVAGDTDAYGKATGYFRPDDPINRAEVAKVLYETLKVRLLDTDIASVN